MKDIIVFIADIFVSIYNVFDVKLFPDMPISLSQFFLGLTAFIIFFSFIKGIVGHSAHASGLKYYFDSKNSKEE